MKNKIRSDASFLRQKAEELIKIIKSVSDLKHSDNKTLKLIHDLEGHQRELELHNEELVQAITDEEAATEKYRELYDFAPSGYFTLSDKGEIAELNLNGATLLGKERKQLINNYFAALISDDTKPVFHTFLEKIFINKTQESCDVALLINGKPPVYVHLLGIAAEDGKHCHVSMVEITGFKQAVDALRKSEALKEKIVANIGDVIVIIDQLGIKRYKSPNVEKLFGWKPEELIGTSSWENVHPEESESIKDFFGTLLSETITSGTTEFRYRCKDGSYKWIEINAVNLLHDPDIQGILGNFHEVSHRKLAEAKLRYVARLFALQSQISQAIVRTRERDELFREICQVSVQYGQFRMAWIGLADETKKTIIPVAQAGIEDGYLDQLLISTENGLLAQGPTGMAHHSEKIVACNDIANDPQMLPWKEEAIKRGYQSSVAIPIKSKNKTIGTLNLYASEAGFFTEDELKLLEKIGENISFGLDVIDSETKHKQAEKKLRESYSRLNNLAIHVPGVVFQYRLYSDGHSAFTYSSPGDFDIYGVTAEEASEDASIVLSRIHPDDNESVVLAISESARNLTLFHQEFRVVLPRKGLQWNLCDANPERMEDGSTLWHGIITDITGRKQAEEALKKVTAAVENANVSIIITNSNGIIEYANPYFTQLTGYLPDEYIGKNPNVFKLAYHPKEFYKEMWHTIKSGKTWEGEFYNIKKNGERYWEYAIISPVVNDKNEITHFVEIKTDISEAKKINEELIVAKEHAEESDRLKSSFLANMSHEIRTPMNGILGFADLLKEPNLTGEEQQEYISIIGKSGARMLNIINDIVDISKIESGQMKVQMKDSNINEQIAYINTFFKPEVERKGLQLDYKYALTSKESVVKTDREKIFAILTNLVKNAIKFTEKGSIEFGYELVETHGHAENRVETHGRASSYDRVENRVETHGRASLQQHGASQQQHGASLQLQFFVRDTGIGIPIDRQTAIFERFIQADIGDRRAFQGAGLGLAISKAYVEMLGGEIWVESEEGKGSVFYFTIPYNVEPTEKEMNANKLSREEKENQINPEVTGLKILIAEDDEGSALLLEKIVEPLCEEVLKTKTGVEAVEICRTYPDVDLILMDVKMPEMDGYEATRQIRKFNTNMVIIAQTAYALTGEREMAMGAGCDDYIAKPFDQHETIALINKHMKERQKNK